MTVKAARHEEGNSEIQGQPSFLIHSFKIMPSLHKALGPLKVWGAARWCMGWSRRLPNGSESLLSVIYLVFNSFQPRTKHFYQSFVGTGSQLGYFNKGWKKGQDVETIPSVAGAEWDDQLSTLGWSLACPPTHLPWFSGVKLYAAPIHLLVLSTRVNEVHLIQRQGPIRLRDRPKKVN